MIKLDYKIYDFFFHKLAYKNDYKNIKLLLKKNKKLLYEKGLYEYPIHIACFIGSEKLINLFIEYDDNILSQKNIKGQSGFHILTLYPNLLLKYIKSMTFNINETDNDGYTILTSYLSQNEDIDFIFLKKLKILGANFNSQENSEKIPEILVKKCDLFDKLNKIFKINVNAYNKKGLTPLHKLITLNNLTCIKKLLTYDVDINNSGIDGKSNIFEYVLRYGNKELINFFINLPINFDYTNQYSDTYLHGIFLSKKNAFPDSIIRNLLDKMNNLNIQNVDGSTIIHLINKTNNWNKYIDILKRKNIDINLIDKNGNSPLDYLSKNESKVFIKKIFNSSKLISLKSPKRANKDINFMKIKSTNHTLFTSYTRDVFIYNIIILEKYKNVGLTFCDNKEKRNIPKDKDRSNINIKFWSGIKLLYENFNGILCTEFYWHSKDLYYMHDNFLNSLERQIDKNYIFFNISLVNLDINHANIVIIDNNLNTIERFDPYGVMDYNDTDNLDKFLENKINKILQDKKGIKYKYLRPKDFLRVNSFQSLSRHEDINNQNTGDVAGFCLAWCFWYLENRINNPNIKQKILVSKLEKKLLSNKTKIIDYIRSYANKLNLGKIKILKEFRISHSEYYKVYPGLKKLFDLYELIFNKIKMLKK